MSAQVFSPDKRTYIRDHAWMAAIAMAGGMAVLWIVGNPHVWTGAVAGLAAIGIRAWYIMSEALEESWEMAEGVLSGPGGRRVALNSVDKVRSLGSAVQVVTTTGDKHLIKYLAHPGEVVGLIEGARTS